MLVAIAIGLALAAAVLAIAARAVALQAVELALKALELAQEPCECVEDLAAADDAIDDVASTLRGELAAIERRLPAPPPPREPRTMERRGW